MFLGLLAELGRFDNWTAAPKTSRHPPHPRRPRTPYAGTSPARVAQVLHAVAEGLSTQADARVFQLSETTVRRWISRAGQHSADPSR
ncbi:MAG: helix-turn-helix domain-containing protein [Anaerolineales bacterium]